MRRVEESGLYRRPVPHTTTSRGNKRLLLIAPQLSIGTPALAPCISPTVHFDYADERFWLASLAIGQWRIRFVRFHLIPVSYGRKIECQIVVVTVLNAESQGFVEVDWINDVKPVHMCAPQPSNIFIDSAIAIEWVSK